MNPHVSVIIPACNRFRDMSYAVESVLAQALPVSEVIIIDDGSVHDPENHRREPGLASARALLLSGKPRAVRYWELRYRKSERKVAGVSCA